MEGAIPTIETDSAAPHTSLVGYAAPPLELPPLTRAELETWFRGGEPEADACEQLLAWAARARGALDLAIGEGLDALRHGDRLAALGCHLDDYAREVLDLGKRSTENLARLGAGLRTRPLLRDALRSGRVRLRAAETVLPLAVGEAEALWVERARVRTVRELEEAVRAARAQPGDAEEEWVRLRTHLPPDERLVVDEALAAAREQPRRPLAPRRLPLARRQRRAREPGRPVRLPSPALHPRRLPRRVRTGAGRARVGVGGTVWNGPLVRGAGAEQLAS